MKPVTVFSWGFWGWGTATRQLIAAVDAAEGRRGFEPPTFVDIRLRRSGRAPGFRSGAFERLLGRRRYRWMPTLGNSNIGTRKAARIACPAAAEHLLDTALDAAERESRLIFFCACESPWKSDCHRHIVAGLLRRVARRRRVGVQVEEWPGGQPSASRRALRVSPATLLAIDRGARAIPLAFSRAPRQWVGVPWGTLVVLHTGKDELPVAVGPAAYRAGRWVLPVFRDDRGQPGRDVRALRLQVAQLRRRYRLD
jgi:hypothetical protein